MRNINKFSKAQLEALKVAKSAKVAEIDAAVKSVSNGAVASRLNQVSAQLVIEIADIEATISSKQ